MYFKINCPNLSAKTKLLGFFGLFWRFVIFLYLWHHFSCAKDRPGGTLKPEKF